MFPFTTSWPLFCCSQFIFFLVNRYNIQLWILNKSEPFLLSVKHGLANCGPWAISGLQLVVDEVLLQHSYTHCFTYCLIQFCVTAAELSSFSRDPKAQNAYSLDPLQKFASPWYKILNRLLCIFVNITSYLRHCISYIPTVSLKVWKIPIDTDFL